MSQPKISLVVARGRNGVIGRDGDLPWRLRSDLQRFKAITVGKPCLMGRKTWESLPLKPLPGRLNIVLTKDESYEADGRAKGALVCFTLDEAIEIARETAQDDGVEEICIIGGTALFEAALPRAKRLYITEVDASPEGDAVFPPFDQTDWIEASAESHPAGEKDDHAFTFRVLERR
ncbi:dihydrofolate reductase [Brevundimonas nasdae]|uniref:Dihydrofolate reductase n=1 Tax=Brevundimonas nasdae TaxID=172043 RepID=A0ABX8TL51_9CAUL|nr:dihydrofolate reductase [Brevundimonas nasdae]QYC11523.1 dihydrofolate reductase [Brevundimonas nasdae]QYC14311.1 dihydrofolate reductase [Brevundimonas nasdae]